MNTSLTEEISNILDSTDNFVIICLGNELLADDGIALEVGESLKNQISGIAEKIIIAHNVPVSFLGKIANQNPDKLIIIDSVDIQEEPGTIMVFSGDLVQNTASTSTHYQEMDDFVEFLERELNKDINVVVIGIQLKNVDYLGNIDPAVRSAGDKLVNAFKSAIDKNHYEDYYMD